MTTQPIAFSLILPCYNEQRLIKESTERIMSALDAGAFTYEIIFVDDKSFDKTAQYIKKICKRYSFCRAVFHETNMGRGRSVMDGIAKARAEIVGYIDIDCEVSPVYLPFMVSLVTEKKSDVVIGKRFYRSTLGSIMREVFSRGYRWLADTMVETGGVDTESGFKVFRKKKIVPIFESIEHQGWFWDTEIMVYAKRAGLKISEVPVLFLRRFDKHSSVNIVKDTVEYLIQLIRFSRSLK